MAYDSISPIGDERLDILTASICQTIANRSGGKDGEGKEPFRLTDFLIDFTGQKSVDDGYPTPEQLLEKAKFINSMVCAMNKVKRERQEAMSLYG